MSARALITGGNGFVGRLLARALIERGDAVAVSGIGGRPPEPVEWFQADVRNQQALDAMVERCQPDIVFHLAGQSSPRDAQYVPVETYEVNCLGIVRLLGAIEQRRAAGLIDPVVLVIGSGTQYGTHEASDMPLVETAELRPDTAYAASKAAQEFAALQFARANGMRVICTRSFNHSGAGQPAQFLLPSLVSRVRDMQKHGATALALGNNVIRDFLHVDDVVRAYILLAERGRAGEVYNVSCGEGVSVRELAHRVLLRAGVSADISTEPSLVRSADAPVLIGSPAKLQRDTGWSPRKTYDDIIDDLLYATTF